MTYPITLSVAGRRCVVVGGGDLAAGKVVGLLSARADVTVVAAEATSGLRALAAGGQVRWLRRGFQPGDLRGAFLAIDAGGDDEVNAKVWKEGDREGVLVNVVDRPERCHFAAPAIVRRGPVSLAVSTSGESPFLAGALRARLERDYGEEWGELALLMGRMRRTLREQGVPAAPQRQAYRRLLASDAPAMLRRGHRDAAEFKAAAIAAGVSVRRPGRVALVGAGPGDPALLTLAARDLLATADAVFHDALVEPETLRLCDPEAELIDVGKRAGRVNPSQESIIGHMIRAASAGKLVVRLKGGDPFMFGRGGEELAALVEARIDTVVVPGVSSVLAAPAAAGIPLTLRGTAASVGVVTARCRNECLDLESIRSAARAVDTLVVLMPLGRLPELVAALIDVVGGDRPAALVSSATTRQQRTVRAPLAALTDAAHRSGIVAPATMIVGEVVGLVAAGARSASSGTVRPR